jgi:hypothetical protein
MPAVHGSQRARLDHSLPHPLRLLHLEDLPGGCRAFRSPANKPDAAGNYAEPRVFYVFDNPEVRFALNAYELRGISGEGSSAAPVQEPGSAFRSRRSIHSDQASSALHLAHAGFGGHAFFATAQPRRTRD